MTILTILAILVGLANLILFIIVLVKLFQEKGVGHGILGIICSLYTFIWGWTKHKELKITNIMEKWEILTDREIEALRICHKSGKTRWMDITFLMTTKGLLNQILKEDEKLSMWE